MTASTTRGPQILVQMSGVPGAGKSSIAGEIARRRGFTALDSDVVKTALLDAGIPGEQAGKASYQVVLALAEDLLGQGNDVIIDSPCLYQDLLEAGQAAAARHDAAYRYIECAVDDLDVIEARLHARPARRSQRPSMAQGPDGAPAADDGPALFRRWAASMTRPEHGLLTLDTSGDFEDCVQRALAFLDADQEQS